MSVCGTRSRAKRVRIFVSFSQLIAKLHVTQWNDTTTFSKIRLIIIFLFRKEIPVENHNDKVQLINNIIISYFSFVQNKIIICECIAFLNKNNLLRLKMNI